MEEGAQGSPEGVEVAGGRCAHPGTFMVLLQAQDCGILSLINLTDLANVPQEALPLVSELQRVDTPEFQLVLE